MIETHVEVKTSITIHDAEHPSVEVKITGDRIELIQNDDRVWLSPSGAAALARILLQNQGLSFEPVYVETPVYVA